MKILFLAFALSFVFVGCGVKSSDNKKTAILQSFTNDLEAAETEYTASFTMTGTIIEKAAKIAEDLNGDEAQQKSINEYLTGFNGMDPAGSDFANIFTNSQKAMDNITKADQDFRSIYINYKELPSSAKDDFYNVKNLMSENLKLIQAFRRGEFRKDTFQDLLANNKKINNSYQSVLLEIERIQNN